MMIRQIQRFTIVALLVLACTAAAEQVAQQAAPPQGPATRPAAPQFEDAGQELRWLRAENQMLRTQVERQQRELDQLRRELAQLKVELADARQQDAGARQPGAQIQTSAQKDAWSGFRDLTWGQNIATIKGLTYSREAHGIKYYVRKTDRLKIGDVQLALLEYGFYKNRLADVVIVQDEPDQWPAFHAAVIAAYGEPNHESLGLSREAWYWIPGKTGKPVHILLSHDSHDRRGFLLLSYEPISAEKAADEKQRAGEAGKDF